MILLIHGYGGNLDRLQRNIISETIAKSGGKIGEYEIREMNIENKDIKTNLKGVEVAYMDLKIPEQGKVGKALERRGIKVVDYEVREMHYRPLREQGERHKTSVYLLKEKIEQDMKQNFNKRKYKKVTFSYAPECKGYRVKLEDVLEMDYTVAKKERQSNNEIRYARNKKEIRAIIEDYKEMHKEKEAEKDHHIEVRKNRIEEIKELIAEIEEEKEKLAQQNDENMRILEDGYNKGVR